MEKFFTDILSSMQKKQLLIRVRRVNWMGFERRIKCCFKQLESSINSSDFGNFYLSIMNDVNQECSSYYKYNLINHIQISCGWKRYPLYNCEFSGDKPKIVPVMENGAALVFSQGFNGKIMVIIYPYKSSLHQMDEKEIILSAGLDPHNLTNEKINNFFKIFIKYCVATSIETADSYSLYAWRLWLRVIDYRSRIKVGKKILATLAVGGKKMLGSIES